MTTAVPAPATPFPDSERPRVYLAGPAVFRPDAREHLARLAALCERHGLRPLLPTDDCGGAADEPLARRIYAANTRMLREADGVLADLQEWRGHEPDSGTAFEVGFAAALALPIVGYGCAAECYADRVSRTRPCERDAVGMLRERDGGMAVEDFGMPLNLMLGCSTRLVPTAEDAIALLAAFFAERRVARTPHPTGSFDTPSRVTLRSIHSEQNPEFIRSCSMSSRSPSLDHLPPVVGGTRTRSGADLDMAARHPDDDRPGAQRRARAAARTP